MTIEATALAVAPSLNLNEDQASAIEAILKWRQEDGAPFFVLRGYAGTGKTYCVKALAEAKKLGRLVFTAPTNKATKVLRETLTTPNYRPECCTIYSLLGLRLEASGEVRELSARDKDDDSLDLDAYDIVIVDEGSMVNQTIMAYIKQAAEEFNVKFLFMGDPAQLPPVKELTSPIWRLDSGATLTKVMRYDNTILDLATRIRNVVDHPAPSVRLLSANDGLEGVWRYAGTDFEMAICQAASVGDFQKVNHTKVIAWRNVTVDKYNKLARAVIFGSEAETWLPTDRLIVTGPCKDLEDNKIANTDDEGEVLRAAPGWHPLAGDVKIWNLTVSFDGGRTVSLRALHEDGQAQYDKRVEELASAARADKRRWKAFWEYKEMFHGVRHAYALTAHRSQGSTYEAVFVDAGDILINKNRQEAFRCLYVACTRAKKRLVIV